MKKILLIIMLCSLVLISGCILGGDKRPSGFPNTKWVSEDPEIWFEVKFPYDYIELYGQMKTDDDYIEIVVLFDAGTAFKLCEVSEVSGEEKRTRILSGYCKYSASSSEKLVVEISKKHEDIFNGKYDTDRKSVV